MSDPPKDLDYDEEENEYNEGSPVTMAQVILTNKLYAELVAEVTERLVAIRKICCASIPVIDKENPARPMFMSIMHILDEDIDMNMFNLGDEND
tara:strand:- start:295 stop:576 length:282 start_codon:yes stop_codon:yes gene_type:complete